MANLLGDNAFLIEQLGFGHTSTSQPSSCTTGIMANYFINSVVSTPGIMRWIAPHIERFLHPVSFQRAKVFSARWTIPTCSLP